MDPTFFATPLAWRAWLARHHAEAEARRRGDERRMEDAPGEPEAEQRDTDRFRRHFFRAARFTTALGVLAG